MSSGEVSHEAYQGEQNAAESTGAGTGYGKNGGSAEGGKPFAQGSRGRSTTGQCPEVKLLGQVQGGSACWVSRGQSPLGRVQGDNACSGVQRVKPLAQ
ncbi:hypothetical protein D7Y41_33220 [Anaerotruncus sp. 1XD22-93]|nr:hypothetical protein D7Y41_33220 [Anaerotruncus sp. 1XD22-93]